MLPHASSATPSITMAGPRDPPEVKAKTVYTMPGMETNVRRAATTTSLARACGSRSVAARGELRRGERIAGEEQDVARVQRLIDEANAVERVQAAGDLHGDRARVQRIQPGRPQRHLACRRRGRALAVRLATQQAILQRRAPERLAYIEAGVVAGDAPVLDGDQVRVAQRGERRVATQDDVGRLPARQLIVDHAHRDRLAELQILAQVVLAHAAGAARAREEVAFIQAGSDAGEALQRRAITGAEREVWRVLPPAGWTNVHERKSSTA